MRMILDVIDGPRKGRSFVCNPGESYIVGRSRHVHCPLPEDTILSRDHFLIRVTTPGCELRDLGSTNGTYVNDRKVSHVWLDTGDRIGAGSSVFEVRIEGADPNRARPVDSPKTVVRTASPKPPDLKCSICGTPAPTGTVVTIEPPDASSDGSDLMLRARDEPDDDPAEWICASCRTSVAAAPQPVPHYTIMRELGRGGMGVVYLAKQNLTGRKVALKLITPESAAARSAIDRFLREMEVMSELKHPNIVEWIEHGFTRGQFWFAMEYVDGRSLEALARRDPGRYPIPQACRMAVQVLKGLEHAHSLGYVHRDIKPENILVGEGLRGKVSKITDFGLAKSFREIGFGGLTFSGEMRGTIPFMPPEQILEFKAVRPSADLYATAATLYYVISGTYLYDLAEDTGEQIRLLLEERPVPIRDRRPEVPEALAKVFDWCLAREPENRCPSATAMRQVLRPFCD